MSGAAGLDGLKESVPEHLGDSLSRAISGKLSHHLSKVVARYMGADDDAEDAAPFLIISDDPK
jgi:hypothetical protein